MMKPKPIEPWIQDAARDMFGDPDRQRAAEHMIERHAPKPNRDTERLEYLLGGFLRSSLLVRMMAKSTDHLRGIIDRAIERNQNKNRH